MVKNVIIGNHFLINPFKTTSWDNKTDRHDILVAEILLKVALKAITLTKVLLLLFMVYHYDKSGLIIILKLVQTP
jgi:hypothetical protein